MYVLGVLSLAKILVVRLEQGIVNGLLGKYYKWSNGRPSKDFKNLELVTTRIDPQVNFVWWDEPAPGVPADRFAVEWTGYVVVDTAGYYRFYLEVDDGGVLWVRDQVLIDAWKEQPPTVYHSDIVELSAGYHTLRLRFFNNEVFAVVRLGWITPDGKAEIIPSSNLVVRKGDYIVIKGLPQNYRIEMWSGELLESAIVKGEEARINASKLEEPVDAYFKVYDGEGRLVGETPVVRNVWGGDVFQLTIT